MVKQRVLTIVTRVLLLIWGRRNDWRLVVACILGKILGISLSREQPHRGVTYTIKEMFNELKIMDTFTFSVVDYRLVKGHYLVTMTVSWKPSDYMII